MVTAYLPFACASADSTFTLVFNPNRVPKGTSNYHCELPAIHKVVREDGVCFVKGPVSDVAAACRDDSKCAGFVVSTKAVQGAVLPGGYLKGITAPLEVSPKNDLYVKKRP